MPKIPDFVPAAPPKKRTTKKFVPSTYDAAANQNGNGSSKVKIRIRNWNGKRVKVKVIPPRPEAAMVESKILWGDGPRKRKSLGVTR